MKILSLSIPGYGNISGAGGVPQGGQATLTRVIGVGLTLLLIAAVILSLFYLIWGGIDWVMSEGDKQKLQSARQKIVFSIVGLTVAFLSFFIINLIFNFFLGGGGSTGTPFCPPFQTCPI